MLKCFSMLKNKNSRQTQDIPMFLWKAISVHILKHVTFIVNQMFTTGMFPSLLKSANITPIYKKGKHNMVENFRPISVTHNLSKILERIILLRIISFANKNNLLPPHQFGFRSNHSTKDAVVSLMLKIESNILKKQKHAVSSWI